MYACYEQHLYDDAVISYMTLYIIVLTSIQIELYFAPGSDTLKHIGSFRKYLTILHIAYFVIIVCFSLVIMKEICLFLNIVNLNFGV